MSLPNISPEAFGFRLKLPVCPGQVGLRFDQHQIGYLAALITGLESDKKVDVFLISVDVAELRLGKGATGHCAGVRVEVERELDPIQMVIHGEEYLLGHINADTTAEICSKFVVETRRFPVETEGFPEDGETLFSGRANGGVRLFGTCCTSSVDC